MSISTQITRIKTASNTIKSKTQQIGISDEGDKLDIVATKLNNTTFIKAYHTAGLPAPSLGSDGDICVVY